jgi:hypothetical protein
VDHFLVYFPVSTFNDIVLRHSAFLTVELAIFGHPIEVLM